jgi:hypothetical protein
VEEFLTRVKKKRSITLPLGIDVKEGDIIKVGVEVVKKKEEAGEDGEIA